MKIVHLMLACFYIDNYSYQENMLPKYHKLLGHEVEIIASLFSFDSKGEGYYLPKGSKYINEYGIPVTRLDYLNIPFSKTFRKYKGLEAELNRINPDLIFIHGLQFADIVKLKKYKESHKEVRIIIDNHADYSNSATNIISKVVLHEKIWRHYAQLINPYVDKFYGVMPSRVNFLVDEYLLPKEKVDLLVMGADDERITQASDSKVRKHIREKYNICEDDFLIITGGKIDAFKQQILLLMQAVHKIENEKLKLLVFGSVTDEMRSDVESLSDGIKVQYIGWIDSDKTYDYFGAADLAVFPGRHSVFWEQVVAQGIPMICKKWEGTTHIDIGGNVLFINSDSINQIESLIKDVMKEGVYQKMKAIAEGDGKMSFRYSRIAEKSLALYQ